MPDPAELLAVARLLSSSSGTTSPSDAQLRRAVSTAYYAVFHTVLRAAAQRFMGPGQEHAAGYTLLYRSLNHSPVRKVCEVLQFSTLNNKYKVSLRRTSVSQQMRDFAGSFPDLQDARNLADYDPSKTFQVSDVASVVDAAEVAIETFNAVPADEKADVFALMMAGSRG